MTVTRGGAGAIICSMALLLVMHNSRDEASAEYPRKIEASISIRADMILIHGRAFDMGNSIEDDDEGDEKPVHRVTIDDFNMAKNELTVREWRAYLRATGKSMPDEPSWGWHDDHPIVNISWFDAVDYCNWLSKKDGLKTVYSISGNTVRADWRAGGYRLPTEAEWEYAARSGGKKHRFGNGRNTADPEQINFDARENWKRPYSVVGKYRKKTTPVGSFMPNNLGLFDMSGNVWEWVWDCPTVYESKPQINPHGPDSGMFRIVRGGSWDFGPWYTRVSSRSFKGPDNRNDVIGFRLARNAR